MRLGIYSRVSTEEQSQKGISLDDQIQRGIECSKRFTYDDYSVFKDAGFSGTIPFDKRPGLNELIQAILNDEVQGLFVTDLDRLSRDSLQSQILKSILIENEVRLFDVNGEIDLSDENQELLADLRSLLASFEIKKTSKRIKRVLERNVINGKVTGGPIMNYGYTKDEDKNLIVDEEEAEIVRWIYELCIEGKGTKVIANELNEAKVPTKRSKSKTGYMKVRGKTQTEFAWRDSVVYRILTNPIYKGKRLYKGKTYDCPSIVSEAAFDAVQQCLKERQHLKNTTNKYFYLLKGKIICMKCGRRMYGRKREDLSDNQYICSSQRYTNTFCGNRGINIDFLNDAVLKNLKNLDKDIIKFYDWFKETDQVKRHSLKALSSRKKEKAAEKQIRNLIDLGTKSDSIDMTFFNEKMKELNKELETAKKDKLNAVNEMTTLHTKDEVLGIVREHTDKMTKDLDDNQKLQIVRALVAKIDVLWIEEDKTHFIYIQYKIDKLTEFLLSAELKQGYDKKGWRLERQPKLQKTLTANKIVTDVETGNPVVDFPHFKLS